MENPMEWAIDDILAATGGDLLSAACRMRFPRIRIDSRRLEPGEVFVAIEGVRFDGHDFIEAAVGKQTGCLIIRRDKMEFFPTGYFEEKGICCVGVEDTTRALGDLAAYRRKQSSIPVVAITGSTGKTTTREMAAAICRRRSETLSTAGNFNNEIGLPLTLFNLTPAHRLAVLELGMNRPGEIGRLSAICTPDIGVITNIGPAHLEGLRDVASVARAKGELLENIREGGIAVLNADDEYGRKLTPGPSVQTLMFGTTDDAAVRAEKIFRKNGTVSFTLVLPEASVDIHLKVYGVFMVANALAAAAVAHALGFGAEDIRGGLESFSAVEGRMMIYETPAGAYIIDDTYNANPMSMEAAIRSLTELTGKKRGVLVAGDMMELGDSARYYHERIGRIAGEADISRLYLTGSYAARVAFGAKAAGMDSTDIFVGTKADIVKDLNLWLKQGDWVLVKGSRSAGMEEIVRHMTTEARVHSPLSGS